VVVGGGAVGSSFVKVLSDKVPSLNIALLESRNPPPFQGITKEGKDGSKNILPNARAYALSPRNLNLLGQDLFTRIIDSGRIGIYDHMQIWESDGPATIHFTPQDSTLIPKLSIHGNDTSILGAVVEDDVIVSCLWEELSQRNNHVQLLSPVMLKSINQPMDHSHPITIKYQDDNNGDNSDGIQHELTADLIVAADGSNSFVRRTLGTFPTISNDYGRRAITCTVELDRSIGQTAFQRFQPNGPVALLPIWNKDDKYYANIVYSTTPEESILLQQASEDIFITKLNDMLQSGPAALPPLLCNNNNNNNNFSIPRPISDVVNGIDMLSRSANAGLSLSGWTEREQGFVIPPLITGIVGRRFTFDLKMMQAKSYVSSRCALIGDAAHTVHPMAGQGLNLGLGDAECLANNIQNAVSSGMGIKSNAGLQYSLQQYESERIKEVTAMICGIQGFHQVFSMTSSPLLHMRSLGMNIVNSSDMIRKKFSEVATGVHGVFHA